MSHSTHDQHQPPVSPKRFICELEVRAYELDGFGHVNHARFLHYFEQARWKLMEEAGIRYKHLEIHERWPVIAQIEVQYKKPLLAGEVIHVVTQVTDSKRSSLFLLQEILRDGEVCAIAKVRSVLVNREGKPAAAPEHMLKIWESWKTGGQ